MKRKEQQLEAARKNECAKMTEEGQGKKGKKRES
jgi:hypothetical protein